MLRALDTTEPLDRFLEIKAEMDRLKEELDELKPLITSALMEEPEQHCLYRGCEICLGERKSWIYSDWWRAIRNCGLQGGGASQRDSGASRLHHVPYCQVLRD